MLVAGWKPGWGGGTLREACCTTVSYLLGSDSLCLTVWNPPYYRTSINKREGKELSMNTCQAVHQASTSRPSHGLQCSTVQYEFKHTPGLFGQDSAEGISQANHSALLTTSKGDRGRERGRERAGISQKEAIFYDPRR